MQLLLRINVNDVSIMAHKLGDVNKLAGQLASAIPNYYLRDSNANKYYYTAHNSNKPQIAKKEFWTQ